MTEQQTIASFNECLTLQANMNSVVNTDWKNAGYNWRRAMWIESAELVDHLGYKWWKSVGADPDRKQILLEVVDIFHFLLSELLLDNRTAIDINNAYKWAQKHSYAPTKEEKIKQVEEFVATCLDGGPVMTGFFQVMIVLGVSVEDLLKYYLGKNALNTFRQANGYKAGTYQKEWMFQGNLVEDNKVLEHILESSGLTSFDTIYNELGALYVNV